jgi:hypothetical protein
MYLRGVEGRGCTACTNNVEPRPLNCIHEIRTPAQNIKQTWRTLKFA